MLQNENISYVVGVNAEFARPNSILAGDRNLTNDWIMPAAVLHLGAGTSIRWTRELHRYKGNLLFADGRVEELNNEQWASVRAAAPANEDLFLPAIQGPKVLTSSGVSGPSGSNWFPVSGSNVVTGPAVSQPGMRELKVPRGIVPLYPFQCGNGTGEPPKPAVVSTSAAAPAPLVATPAPPSDGSSVLQWFAGMAELMKVPVWLLYVLLLLLLAGLLAISRRRRWR